MYILRRSKKMSAKHTNHTRDDILAISTALAFYSIMIKPFVLLCSLSLPSLPRNEYNFVDFNWGWIITSQAFRNKLGPSIELCYYKQSRSEISSGSIKSLHLHVVFHLPKSQIQKDCRKSMPPDLSVVFGNYISL